jgi:hypothetical protein
MRNSGSVRANDILGHENELLSDQHNAFGENSERTGRVHAI